jgi:hypothetical protein
MSDFNAKFALLLDAYPEIIGERRKFEGLLRDFFPKETKRIRLLTNLHELAVPEEIRGADTVLDDKFAYRYVKRLVEEYGVDELNALWGVQVWCLCYGGEILGKSCDINFVEDSFVYAVDLSDREFGASDESNTHNAQNPRIEADGYYICGIIESARCNHKYANVYALIYNYITQMPCTPKYFRDMKMLFTLDYSKVSRLMTVILQLIRNNYITESDVNFRYDDDVSELRCALVIINNYADVFCRLIGLPPCTPLRISDKSKAVTISFLKKSGVYIEEDSRAQIRAVSWNGQRINYRLSSKNLKDLQYILEDCTTFHSFRDGQFDTLRKMLCSDEHTLCEMPAGKGKSLLLLLAVLLQPVPTFVIAPDESVAEAQLGNMREVHGFEHAGFMTYKEFGETGAGGDCVSFVLLDEVNCLANSHREMSFEKIGNLAASESVGRSAFTNAARFNKIVRSYGLDLLNILVKLRYESELDENLLKRVVRKTAKQNFLGFVSAVAKVYGMCDNATRLKIHNVIGESMSLCGMSYATFYGVIYLTNPKDLIYYGTLADRINPLLKKVV